MTPGDINKGGIAEERFQLLADWLPVIVWRISADFESDWVNSRWTAFTGAKSGSQTGFTWLDLVHPDDRRRLVAAVDEAFNAQLPLEVSFRLRRLDGEFRWMTDCGIPVFRNGVFDGFVGTRLDVHEQRRSADLLEGFRASLGEVFLLERAS